MIAFKNRNRTRGSASLTLPAPAETAFPLLCPVREYDWIDTWRCEMIHSVSGIAEEGCIFRTQPVAALGIGWETWVCVLYAPPRRIAYVRTSEHLLMRLDIGLEPADGGARCRTTFALTATGLDDEGDGLIDRLAPTLEPLYSKVLAKLAHFLATGAKLPNTEAAARTG